MSKSLVQMVNELFARVAKLEQAERDRAVTNLVVQQVIDSHLLASKPLDREKVVENVAKIGRAMCPKCGVKPNYYLHVKHCLGQKDGDKATDQRRDQS